MNSGCVSWKVSVSYFKARFKDKSNFYLKKLLRLVFKSMASALSQSEWDSGFVDESETEYRKTLSSYSKAGYLFKSRLSIQKPAIFPGKFVVEWQY